jgi:hypothetical protein
LCNLGFGSSSGGGGHGGKGHDDGH